MSDLSLVLTYYNEALILEKSVKEITGFLNQVKLDVELIFVDDCSNDESHEILNRLKNTELKTFSCQYHRNSEKMGRGACVDLGFTKANSDVVRFIDTDLDIPIYYVLPAYLKFKNEDCDALIGRRSFIFFFRKFIRILMTQTYSKLVRVYLNFPYQQTEAGFKLFKKEKYLELRKHIVEKHWFWDTEVMMLSNYYGLKVYEMPITVIQQQLRPTNVKFLNDTLRSLKASVQIKKRLKKIKKNDSRN